MDLSKRVDMIDIIQKIVFMGKQLIELNYFLSSNTTAQNIQYSPFN